MSNPRPANKAPLADIFWSMYGEGITAVFIPPQRKVAILYPSTAIAVPLPLGKGGLVPPPLSRSPYLYTNPSTTSWSH